MRVFPLPAFHDNYIWILQSDNSPYCVVVDPGDPDVVLRFLQQHNLILSAILITHHHHDHVGGIKKLKSYFSCFVYGPENKNIEGIDNILHEGDNLSLCEIDTQFQILEVPGHTLDHIAFYSENQSVLFCGDLIFGAGCGRLFEGTPEQMYRSLAKILALPNNTQVHCAHEYTFENLYFAKSVEVNNQNVLQRFNIVEALRVLNLRTIPSTLALEKATNPFLRCAIPTVRQAVIEHTGKNFDKSDEIFAALRAWKDTWDK